MTEKKETPFWLWPAVVSFVAIVVLIIVLVVQNDDTEEDAQTPPPPPSEQNIQDELDPNDLTTIERHDNNDVLAFGAKTAPVTMIVFSDYQCPFCASWSHETLPVLMEEYVENDELRIEWRDVNVFGEASERAAKASYAAALQDKFFEYHDGLFPEGESRSESELEEDALVALAEELNLDIDRFAADMKAPETEEAIAVNEQLGIDLGAFSTPSFIVGGEPVSGALPTEVFQEIIDEKLELYGDVENGN